MIIADAGLTLLVARAALQTVLTWLTNLAAIGSDESSGTYLAIATRSKSLTDFWQLDLAVHVAVEHHRVLDHSGRSNFC